jgi:hypothetical protein
LAEPKLFVLLLESLVSVELDFGKVHLLHAFLNFALVFRRVVMFISTSIESRPLRIQIII